MAENIQNGTKVKATVAPEPEIGIDTNNTVVSNIVSAAINSTLDISELEGFSNVSQSREQIYKLYDTMGKDSTIASILETYTEDSCEANDRGKIIWCESSDPEVSKYVSYLIDIMNVDKYIYSWTYSLCKYGDLYLRLYRESEFDDDPMSKKTSSNKQQSKALNENFLVDDEFGRYTQADIDELEGKTNKKELKEDVNVVIHKENDHYVNYLEAVPNPGEMYELTKFGKTVAYVKAPVSVAVVDSSQIGGISQTYFNRYKIKESDVDIYSATDFVHATLDDSSGRIPEEVSLSWDSEEDIEEYGEVKTTTYQVKRGQSLLANSFKIWREMNLLENSVLLNRLTKSSITRMIAVEVGDMPKEQVANHLASIKQLLEQKSALNTDNSMSEYTNAGPIENNVYIPTHKGVGAISTQSIGGDVDPKQLTDLDWFNNKFFAAMRVPKQYFGFTDDAAGFNGGTSLSIISSRYGKSVKRIQNAIIQVITDAINLMLLDKGLKSYINSFTIRMQAPITQEELDRRDNISNRIRVIGDIMSQLNDITDQKIKLGILKSLLTTVVDEEVINLIQSQIDNLEKEGVEEAETSDNKRPQPEDDLGDIPVPPAPKFEPKDNEEEEPSETTSEINQPEEIVDTGEDSYLPSPQELGIDATQEI